MNEFNYIAVEGVLGVGKTSFAKKLAKDLSARTVLEEVDDNPFLKRFYKDMEGFAFQTQLFFLLNRVKQQEPLKQQTLFQNKIVADYLIEKEKIFANVTMADDELGLYNKIYNIVIDEAELIKPDLVIYLQASTDVLIDRIKQRGRQFEKSIPGEYIYNLSEGYTYFFSHFTGSPLAIVNTDDVDFVKNDDHYALIRDFVLGIKGGINYFTPKPVK